MRKCDELADPKSCLNKANCDEMVFVLLERDDAFEDGIRGWIEGRIKHGLNTRWDAKIAEAERIIEERRKKKAGRAADLMAMGNAIGAALRMTVRDAEDLADRTKLDTLTPANALLARAFADFRAAVEKIIKKPEPEAEKPDNPACAALFQKYVSKVSCCEAFQLTQQLAAALVFGDTPYPPGLTPKNSEYHRGNRILHRAEFGTKTLQGPATAQIGDWIIKEQVEGLCYPCNPTTFEARWQPAAHTT